MPLIDHANNKSKVPSLVSGLMFGIFAVFGISLAAITQSKAQTAPLIDQIVREQNKISSQEQQRRNAERKQVQRPGVRPQKRLQSKLEKLQSQKGSCVQISKINFKGARAFSSDNLGVKVQSFQNKCLTIIDIQNVLRAVTNYYIEENYITSRAYLVSQDLAQGVLSVLVVEGDVEAVEIIENGKNRNGAKQLFGERPGKILNIRDFEQGMDQINRLGSKDAKIRIEPGKKVGGSIVYIDVNDQYNAALSTGVDNDGSSSIGRHQWNASITAEDVFKAHESISVSVKTSLDELHRGVYSKSYNGYFSVPFHYATLNFSGSYSHYNSELVTPAQTLSFSGRSYEARIALDRVVYRNQQAILTIGTGLTLKENRNFIENLFIETSSQRLAIAELSARLSGQAFGGYAQLGLIFKQGLNAFGAQDDGAEPLGTPDAQFSKFELSASYQKAWQGAHGIFGLAVSGNYSASGDTLFSSERMNVGGISTVRGYRDDSLSGDIGGYGRLEINWVPKTQIWNEKSARILGKLQIFASLDSGYIVDDVSDAFEGGYLHGAAAGIRLAGGIFSGELAYEQPLGQKGLQAGFNDRNRGYWRFKFATTFKF